MLSAILTLALTQGGPPPLAPTAYETARLYFLAGELTDAHEWCERGKKKEGKNCTPFLRTLAEYKFLMGKFEELTLEEAAQVLVLDKKLSPKEPGKLTKPILERYVRGPMKRAQSWADQGAAAEAVKFVDDVLTVDPKNAEAKALRQQLLERADAGR